MSAPKVEVTGEVEVDATEGSEENGLRFSPDLVDERIKANLEPLHAEISSLTEKMDRLIQSNSVRETAMASTRETRYHYESRFSGSPGASTFLTVAPLTTSGYSLDTWIVTVPA